MKRIAVILTALLATTFGSAQTFSGGVRLNTQEVAASVTFEIQAFELADWRIAPIVTATATFDWEEWTADALAGLSVSYSPPDSRLAVLIQVHYKLVWSNHERTQIPELFIGFVF